MSKEYKLDQLKKDKVYNETLLSLWSGSATYQDLLATAMIVMGYELRQHNDCFMDLGQNEKESNKVIQLHDKNQSLVLWYAEGYKGAEYLIPILVTKEGATLDFSLYNHENKKLMEHLEELTTKELYNAGDSVFDKLVELVTSERSPLEEKIGLSDYTLNSSDFLRILGTLKNDPENMTTEIELALVDIYELLKGESNKYVYLPTKDKGVDAHYLPEVNYFENQTPQREYKDFIFSTVKEFNDRYFDGTRIILSKHFEEVEVYDDKGLSYSVPIPEFNDKEPSVYRVGSFSCSLEQRVNLAKCANELYSSLGDLEGVEFVQADKMVGSRVRLFFEKRFWDGVKHDVVGVLYFTLGASDYDISFQTSVSGLDKELKLGDEDVLTLGSKPLRFTKSISVPKEKVSERFKECISYTENATLESILRDNSVQVKAQQVEKIE